MTDKTFELIAHDQANRTDMYCNGLYHVTIVHPQNIHSGIPANVSLDACNCKDKSVTPSNQLPASDLNTVNSEVAKERFEVPEATGDPDLTNASLEGSEPVPEVITSEDVQPPADHEEFEALGADAHAHGPAPVKSKKSKG